MDAVAIVPKFLGKNINNWNVIKHWISAAEKEGRQLWEDRLKAERSNFGSDFGVESEFLPGNQNSSRFNPGKQKVQKVTGGKTKFQDWTILKFELILPINYYSSLI